MDNSRAETDSSALLEHGRKYFTDIQNEIHSLNKGKGIPPVPISWEAPNSLLRHANLILSGISPENVTISERNKVAIGEQLVSVSDNSVDKICAMYGFGKYGINLVGKTIIDVGAGNSNFSEHINKCWGEYGTRVIALDYRYPRYSHDKNRLHGDILDLGKEAPTRMLFGQADIVTCSFLLNFFTPDKISTSLSELYKLTKPNGLIKLAPFFTFVPILQDADGQYYFNERSNYDDTKNDYNKIMFPKGFSFSTRLGADTWSLEIDTNVIDANYLADIFLHFSSDPVINNYVGFVPKFDRKGGYYPSAIVRDSKDFRDFVVPDVPMDNSPVIDDAGMIIET